MHTYQQQKEDISPFLSPSCPPTKCQILVLHCLSKPSSRLDPQWRLATLIYGLISCTFPLIARLLNSILQEPASDPQPPVICFR